MASIYDQRFEALLSDDKRLSVYSRNDQSIAKMWETAFKYDGEGSEEWGRQLKGLLEALHRVKDGTGQSAAAIALAGSTNELVRRLAIYQGIEGEYSISAHTEGESTTIQMSIYQDEIG